MSVVGAASSPNLGAQQGCLQECPSFLCAVIAPPPPLFLLISLDMGSDIWVRPLGPIAPQGVAWMHFASIGEALRYLRSEDGGSLRIQLAHGCGTIPCVCSCGARRAVHIHSLGAPCLSYKELPTSNCSVVRNMRTRAHTMCPWPCGGLVGASPP